MVDSIAKHFKFHIKELGITAQYIQELAHVDENMQSFAPFLSHEINGNLAQSLIEGGYVCLPAKVDRETIVVENNYFHVGAAIAKRFRGAAQVAVFACTAGRLVSDRINELNAQRHIMEAYLLDVLGSVMVEKAMDKIQGFIEAECSLKGSNSTNRYSPGYIDWSVEEQTALFSLLPKNYCGITLTESCLMLPVKSISGFIGIGNDVRFQKHECHHCNSINCLYRHSKNHC